jgi:hypothetical protein
LPDPFIITFIPHVRIDYYVCGSKRLQIRVYDLDFEVFAPYLGEKGLMTTISGSIKFIKKRA